MGVHELARLPFRFIRANIEAPRLFAILLDPLRVGPQVSDHLVVFIQQSRAGHQLGDHHHVAMDIHIRRPTKTVERLAMFAREREPLQAVKLPIGNDHQRLLASAIDPNAMRQLECAVALLGVGAGRAKRADPIRISVVAMHAIRPVAVDQKEPAVGQKRDVGRYESIPTPRIVVLRSRKLVLTVGVDPALHGGTLPPNLLPIVSSLAKERCC